MARMESTRRHEDAYPSRKRQAPRLPSDAPGAILNAQPFEA